MKELNKLHCFPFQNGSGAGAEEEEMPEMTSLSNRFSFFEHFEEKEEEKKRKKKCFRMTPPPDGEEEEVRLAWKG